MIRSFVQRMGERSPADYFGRLDPRAKLIFMALVIAFAAFEHKALIGLYILVAVLGIASGLWRMLVLSTLGGVVMWLGFVKVLMPLSGDVNKEPFMLFADMEYRISIYSVVGFWFAVKTNLYEFECSLEKWRVPSNVVLPFIISIRFVPTLLAEFAAVRDAMRQRRVLTSFGSAVANPSMSFRYFITPMLIRSLKMADELTVAAETRGIGRPCCRSYYREVNFGGREKVFLGCTVLLLVANSIIFRLSWISGWFNK